jgi:dolichol kinase
MQAQFPTLVDTIVLVVAYVWVIAVIGFGELLRRAKNYSPAVTRKVIHLGAGFSAFTVPFYTHPWAALIVALSFVLLIFLSSPKSPVKSLRTMFTVMARKEDYLSGHIWGPFLYAISITVLVAAFTLIPSLTPFFMLPATGLIAMYIGDGLAPIVGLKYGKHRYTIGKSWRSLEGSLTVFVGSTLGAVFCFFFFGWFAPVFLSTMWPPYFSPLQVAILVLVCGAAATIIEGVSPPGGDNLSVPLLTSLIVFGVALLLSPSLIALVLAP